MAEGQSVLRALGDYSSRYGATSPSPSFYPAPETGPETPEGDSGSDQDSLVSRGRRTYTLTEERSSFFTSDHFMRLCVRVVYGLLPCWPRSTNRCRAVLSIMLGIVQWLAFSEYLHCVTSYWTGELGPSIPRGTLVVELALFTSGLISFPLACRYFYIRSQNFQNSYSLLIPHVDFGLRDPHEAPGRTCGLKGRDWLWTNIVLVVAVMNVILVILVDVVWDSYFDFYGIHQFTKGIQSWEKAIYYAYVYIFYYVMVCAIVSCCVFHVLTRDIVRHVEFTEKQILDHAQSFLEAKQFHEELLNYSAKLISRFDLWFTTHNIFYFFIVICNIFEWLEALHAGTSGQVMSHKIVWLSQFSASAVIAFKFAFPFLSASCVTMRFEEMYYRINRKKIFHNVYDLSKFLNYAERCNYGFVVFGFKITTNVALVTLLTSFIGILKFFNSN